MYITYLKPSYNIIIINVDSDMHAVAVPSTDVKLNKTLAVFPLIIFNRFSARYMQQLHACHNNYVAWLPLGGVHSMVVLWWS